MLDRAITGAEDEQVSDDWVAIKPNMETVVRNGKIVAVIVPYDEYLALLEELEDLRDAVEAEAEMQEYERDPSTARPWEEVEAELIAEGLLDPDE